MEDSYNFSLEIYIKIASFIENIQDFLHFTTTVYIFEPINFRNILINYICAISYSRGKFIKVNKKYQNCRGYVFKELHKIQVKYGDIFRNLDLSKFMLNNVCELLSVNDICHENEFCNFIMNKTEYYSHTNIPGQFNIYFKRFVFNSCFYFKSRVCLVSSMLKCDKYIAFNDCKYLSPINSDDSTEYYICEDIEFCNTASVQIFIELFPEDIILKIV